MIEAFKRSGLKRFSYFLNSLHFFDDSGYFMGMQKNIFKYIKKGKEKHNKEYYYSPEYVGEPITITPDTPVMVKTLEEFDVADGLIVLGTNNFNLKKRGIISIVSKLDTPGQISILLFSVTDEPVTIYEGDEIANIHYVK